MNDEKETPTLGNIFMLELESVIFLEKIAAKITGKTAKKIATKAAEKGMEKIGEKTGQLIGEKIYDKFTKPPPKPEVGGKEIRAILQETPKTDKFQYIKDVYNDIL